MGPNMTVDVLAVLRRHAIAERERLGTTDNDTQAALAAVDELIRAACEASGTLGHIYHTTPLPYELEQHAHAGYQRLDAALARVQGGAA